MLLLPLNYLLFNIRYRNLTLNVNTFQALKSEVPIHDPKFDSVTKALDDAKDVTQEDGKELDQDIAAHEPACNDMTESWKRVKSQLDVTLNAVKVAIPIAEKCMYHMVKSDEHNVIVLVFTNCFTYVLYKWLHKISSLFILT